MSLETRLIALAQAVGTDVKGINSRIGDLSSLSTTAKNNLVAALNEVFAAIGDAGAQIDDEAGAGDTLVTWSADKLVAALDQTKQDVKSELIDGAPEALDTLVELADALNNNPNFAAEMATQLSNRVRFDDEQTLSAAQKLQACTNIGVGDPEYDFVADYNTAKSETHESDQPHPRTGAGHRHRHQAGAKRHRVQGQRG